ncbi:MAG: hypothetical protein QF890_16730 [Myxococcota bacterium]|nr:hypothetical protein [Myxococcota bacterium]MDP6243253.1 hypothetical protein [Myxococcota bacterium]MDP7073928.1 hypothetical protein [Myxococcota bacterium]MDP7299382.1 hypothetical protein [Myxococcota bacterium]MDP7434204.1 hypothetical protein [Myxococcota bacterium]
MRSVAGLVVVIVAVFVGGAGAFPGGTPSYQTDVAPYCAGCHSSRNLEMLEGGHDRAKKETAERKHISLILSGQKGYASLTETDRKTLAEQIRAVDEASTVSITAPAQVLAGEVFPVTVQVTGGAGPVVAIALVDRAHRWYARPAASAGWSSAAPPQVTGPDGQLQTAWLEKRPAEDGREISFVNITGVEADAATGRWSSASVVFTLRAPLEPGTLPLAAAYLYGTEKATVLGYTTNAVGWKEPRGGLGGASGRVLFSDVSQIEVVPAAPPAPAGAPPPVE